MFSKHAKLESYYNKCYNWIRLTFLSGARNALITRGKKWISNEYFLTDDSIHKKLFPCLNPCRSHSNDILCVCVCCCVGGQMPVCEEMFKGGSCGFNTTLLHDSDSNVKLSPPPAQWSVLPNSEMLQPMYQHHTSSFIYLYRNVSFSNT